MQRKFFCCARLLSQTFRTTLIIFWSLWITIKVCHFLPAKVAVQIVDYYNLALNTLDVGGSEDCSLPETLGTKIYKVSSYVAPQK
jgi:hypothetical protein